MCAERAVWLQWQEDDVTSQIGDDWYNYVMESGCSDVSMVWLCELETGKVASLFRSMERYIGRLIWAEKMIGLVGTVA